MKILVIDDERELGEVVCEYLTARGHQCRAACSIEEGRQAFGEFKPESVVLDQFLPDGSGSDLIPELKAQPGTWIVCVSGSGDPKIGQNALATGADRFMGKPMSMKLLLENLEARPGF